MKNRIIVLMTTIMIIGLITGSATASDWEAIGGLQIVNVTLDTYNDTIKKFNSGVESGLGHILPEPIEPIKTSNLEKFDSIDRVPLIYVGAKRKINEKWDLNIRYEYIFGEVEQSYTSGGISHDNSIEVALHGLTFLADYEINDNWYATGGIGYHQGTKETKLNGPIYETLGPLSDSFDAGDQKYDLDNGISLRGGVGYTRSFAENWDFNAQIDYLYIELDDEGQGNIYSKGFTYAAGLTYNF